MTAIAFGALFLCLGAPAFLLSIHVLGIVALEPGSWGTVVMAAAVLAAYGAAGVVAGLLFSLAGTADEVIEEVGSKLPRALDPAMAALIEDSALGDKGVDFERLEQLLGLQAFASHSSSRHRWMSWLGRMLHRRLMKKVLETVRLSMVADLPRWLKERGESQVTVKAVEAFARERLVQAVTDNLRSRMRKLRKRILTAGAVAVLGPVALVSALAIAGLGRPLLDRGVTDLGRAVGQAGPSADQAPKPLGDLDVARRGSGPAGGSSPSTGSEGEGRSAPCQRLKPSPGPGAAGSTPEKPPPQKFDRPMPHSNVVTLGHPGPAKALLTSAITRVLYVQGLATYVSPGCLAIPEKPARDGVAVTHVEYQSTSRHYAHAELHNQVDYVKALITKPWIDGTILVVSAVGGVTREIREQLWLAQQVGMPPFAVFIDDADRVSEPDRVTREVKELLSRHRMAVADPLIVLGSARRALDDDASAPGAPSVQRLIDILDVHVPAFRNGRGAPFLMAVQDMFRISDRGLTIATGRVDRGVIKVGEEIEIVGLDQTRRTRVAAIEMFRKLLDQAQAGDKVGLGLRGIERVERGQVLAVPGTIMARKRFTALLYAFTTQDGGRRLPFFTGYRPQFYFRVTDFTGTVTLPQGVDKVMPGQYARLTVDLALPVALETGLRFAVREGGRTVGVGVVLED